MFLCWWQYVPMRKVALICMYTALAKHCNAAFIQLVMWAFVDICYQYSTYMVLYTARSLLNTISHFIPLSSHCTVLTQTDMREHNIGIMWAREYQLSTFYDQLFHLYEWINKSTGCANAIRLRVPFARYPCSSMLVCLVILHTEVDLRVTWRVVHCIQRFPMYINTPGCNICTMHNGTCVHIHVCMSIMYSTQCRHCEHHVSHKTYLNNWHSSSTNSHNISVAICFKYMLNGPYCLFCFW
jgi:hypothetical protein